MRYMVRYVFAIMMLLLILILTGCTRNKADDNEARKIINLKKIYADIDVGAGDNDDIFVDVNTKVLYFRDWSNGLTPIYNADGTLKTWDC